MGRTIEDTFWIKEGEITDLWAFILAINWKEKWLLVLMAGHLLCLVGIFLTRKFTNIQLFMFISLCGLALSSQKLNELCAKHWRIFAKEQYFDSHGIFITVVFAGPIMFNCLILVILWLLEVGKLLIKTKRQQVLRVQSSSEKDSSKKNKKE